MNVITKFEDGLAEIRISPKSAKSKSILNLAWGCGGNRARISKGRDGEMVFTLVPSGGIEENAEIKEEFNPASMSQGA